MRRASISVIAALVLLVAAVAIGQSAGGAVPPPVKKVGMTGTKCANGLYCYKPAAFNVKRGTKVVWTNNSSVIHTVKRCTKAKCGGVNGLNGGTGKQTGFGSGIIPPHKTYAFTFKLPGTYNFYCNVHGFGVMHGTVIVR